MNIKKEIKEYNAFVLLFIYLIVLILSQISGKLGSNYFSVDDLVFHKTSFLYVTISYMLMIVSGFVWIFIIRTIDLSYAYSFISLSYVIMLFVSHYMFSETITAWKVGGSLLIIFGVVIVASELGVNEA